MHRSRKKSVFLNLLISYFLVSLVPLIVLTGTLYYFIVINNQKELREKNTSRLTSVMSSIDSELRKLEDTAYHFSALMSEGEIDVGSSPKAIVDRLEAYEKECDFVEDILYYVKGDKDIYSVKGKFYYAVYEETYGSDLDMRNAAFVTRLNKSTAPNAGVIEYADNNEADNANMVALYYPVPHLSSNPSGVMTFLVLQSFFLGEFSASFGDFDGYTYLFDEYYEIIASTEQGMSQSNFARLEEELKRTKGSGIFDLQVDGTDFAIIKVTSEETGWTYVIAMPPGQYTADIRLMWNIVVTIVIVTFMVGIVLTYIMSMKRYSPIKSIIAGLIGTDLKTEGSGNNEFEVIQSALDRAHERNALLSHQVDSQLPFIRDQCLLRIIGHRESGADELDYLIKCSNLNLEGDEYFVAVLSIKGEETYLTRKTELVLELVEEISSPGVCGYGVELVRGSRIAMVFCLSDHNTSVDRQRGLAVDINNQIMKAFKFSVDIGVGRPYQDVAMLNKSFHEASAALDNHFTDSESRIFLYSGSDDNSQINWHSIKEQSLFLQSLKSGDKTVAQSSFGDMLHSISEQHNSPLVMKCVCYDIVNNIIRFINQRNLEGFSSQVTEILEFKSLADFEIAMTKFIDAFCDAIGDLEERHRNRMKHAIIDYIGEHYASTQISLESVAGKFKLTTTYLSRFFKDATGVNYLEYVTNLRMNEAKRQLRSSTKSIRTIMSSVGYLDTASFVRKFKSMEGVTPGQYRQINKT